MMKARCLGVLLLFAHIGQIVCPANHMLPRNDNIYFPDTHRPTSDQIQQELKLNRTIADIFKLGDEPGAVIFNKSSSVFTPAKPVKTPSGATSSREGELFKVQRTPDGKLDLVFNDLFFLQTPAQQPTTEVIPQKDPFVASANHFNCNDGDFSLNKTFCTKLKNYPNLSHLENVLQRDFSQFFGEDYTQPLDITQRMNLEPDEEQLCDTEPKTIIYPEKGLTKDNSWLVIINDQNKFKQGVRIERCRNEQSQCKLLDSLPNHYEAICKQNYIYRTLVALTDNGTITKDSFKMPSCCKCVLRILRN